MIWKSENGITGWLGLEGGCISAAGDVLEEMLKLRHGILILDGISGCGKTKLLHQFREKSKTPVAIHSYREVIEELVHVYKKMEDQSREKIFSLLSAHPILAVEDVDYLRGKDATQEILGAMFSEVAQQALIILTGNDLEGCVPGMLQCMKQARHLKFLYPGSPEDEMLSIGWILPEDGMDRRLLEQVLSPRQQQAMLYLIRAGWFREDLLHRVSAVKLPDSRNGERSDVHNAFLEALWQWQQGNDEGLCFRQIRDCFCKAAAVMEDRDGTIAFRAAELMKESGELEQAAELYGQVLDHVLRLDSRDAVALSRGHRCRGIALGYRCAKKLEEHVENGMREAVEHFHQALKHGEACGGLDTCETTQILWGLVYGYACLGELTKAEEYCLEILRIQETLPENHPDRVETCIQFSQLCRDFGRRLDCHKWLLRAAELLEQVQPTEDMAWMYGLVACNCRKLSDEKRLELYQKEEQYSRRRFLRNPRDGYRWHWQVAQLQAGMGNIPEAVRHKEEIPSCEDDFGDWEDIQALFSRKKTEE